MHIEKIIALANTKVRLRFLAMERSLRATGCDLPLWVIPYDDTRFELPEGALWWEMPEITGWLADRKSHPVMRKYQTLTAENFQFVDSDVCFLRNPVDVLAPHSGFITSCGHWHNPDETVTGQSRKAMSERSTTWQQFIFNTGQYACDRALYTVESLKRQIETPAYIETCLRLPWHEQPGINLLVWGSRVPITNLTLTPNRMESTWAGDYSTDDYESYWTPADRKPYLLHWAGTRMEVPRPINRIFLEFLTSEERSEWKRQLTEQTAAHARRQRSARAILRRLRNACRAFDGAWNQF
jgi:hypothetical protein